MGSIILDAAAKVKYKQVLSKVSIFGKPTLWIEGVCEDALTALPEQLRGS